MTTLTAHTGDRLLLARHDQAYRVAVVLGVEHPDGSPPYRVRWLDDGKEGLVFPGEGARVEPACRPAAGTTPRPERNCAPLQDVSS
ncbi:DUF1918 domain-containing protein [Actinocatenispora sera]|uniref:DUF1918 domain-containing protein n=1 Tax=Actinocatenispora sera TaxID=390989 RepID=UPI0033F90DFC